MIESAVDEEGGATGSCIQQTKETEEQTPPIDIPIPHFILNTLFHTNYFKQVFTDVSSHLSTLMPTS